MHFSQNRVVHLNHSGAHKSITVHICHYTNLYANFRFKVLNSLLEMEGRPRIHHPLSSYLDMTKDKNGMIKTRLKIPYWSRQEPQPPVDLSDEVN